MKANTSDADRENGTRRAVVVFLGSITLLSGCVLFASNNSLGESWKGSKIRSLEDAWGPPTVVIETEDGSKEFKYVIFHGSCAYYFVTDATGTITGYHHEGSCIPIG